jgi:hypothetical protein
MPTSKIGLSPGSLKRPVIEMLRGTSADKQIVSDQLNAVLKSGLISFAVSDEQTVLAKVLETLAPADLLADGSLSLRDFVTKNVTLRTDSAAKQTAQEAFARLSSTTTVGALLGLDKAILDNPGLSGIVAQTNLATLLATSPTLASAQLQTDFMQKYAAFQGTTQEFWAQLSQDAEFKPAMAELQFTIQLGMLTLNNPQFVSALRATYKLSSIRSLTSLDAAALTQLINAYKIPIPDGISGSTPDEQLSNYVNGIVDLLQQAFPTDYVAKQLAASSDSTLQLVAKVLSNAPEIDLRFTRIDPFLEQNSAKAFQNVPPDQVPAVTKALKSVQRVQRIVGANSDSSALATLLSAGLDSASKIVAIPRAAFLQRFSSALGGESQAQAVHSTAIHISAQASNAFRAVQSALQEINPRAIGNPDFKLSEKIGQQIPNWEDLFGPTSYCACAECSSVYGPAAYFVDLLQFLRNSKGNKPDGDGFTPLDILIGGTSNGETVPGRRPDLAFIKLNCQNANTPLPYVDLVNEVLESYVAHGTLDQSAAHNTPLYAKAEELSVNPEYTLDAAYTLLAQASYPLALPYDRFLDVARTYLAFLGGDRRQVIELFQTQQAPVDTTAMLAAETLGFSQAEFQLIANWNFQLASTATPPLPSPESLYAGNAAVTGTWEQWISSVPTFLKQTDLALADLVNLFTTQFINPGQTITLAAPDPCDLEHMSITPLDDPTLTKILPFLRMWKKLGWPMSDLDKALRVFAPTGINRGCLLALADLRQLLSELNISLPQLLSFWSDIDTDGRSSLYLSLFQNKAVLNPLDPAFQLSYRAALPVQPAAALPPTVNGQAIGDSANHRLTFIGMMTDDQRVDLLRWASGNAGATLAVENLYQMRWAAGTDITPTATITNQTPAVLAALRISADDLNAIRVATGLVDTPTKTVLNLANLTQLYRYTLLAQALRVQIPDLISLISLTGINPFQLSTTDPVTRPTISFVQAARAVLASPFSVAELDYIYRAISDPAAGLGPLDANINSLVATLQTGLVKIAAANRFTPDPTGKLLRQKLGTVVGGSQLTKAMDLISGNAVYQASLSALPSGISLPVYLSYDSADELLRLNGPMSDSQKADLLALSSDALYQDAVSNLYEQPRDIIAHNLGFLDPTDAIAKLINSPAPDVADRYSYVLQHLLDYLTDTQSRNLVQQSLSQALALDSATVALLVSGSSSLAPSALLKSQRDANEPAVVDFLDLRDGGLLVTYFSDTNLTAATGSRIASTVSGSGVSSPGGARWVGNLQPEFSESYTFYVTANDGVRLWVDDQLLIDSWSNQPISVHASAPITLNAGQMYNIRLDYYNASATPTVALEWSGKSTSNNARVAIPQSALFPGNAFQALRRLYPIGLLLSKFGVKSDEVAYLAAHPGDFAGVDPGNSANTVNFDLAALPVDRSNPAAVDQKASAFFNQWSHLNDLFALRNSLPSGNVGLFDIFRAASSSTSPALLSSPTSGAVVAATGWNVNEFATLSGKATANSVTVGFGLSDADFVNANGQRGTGLVWLKKCLDLSGRLGVPALQLFQWANGAPSSLQADDIKNTVKAKYDDATWLAVGKPLNDKIRDNSRAALIAYVLDMPPIRAASISNPDKLYEYLLIDVQMSPCMLTSRLVQATAAVQLFIQRCLLGLENSHTDPDLNLNVSPDAIDAGQWEWRKNYRVWEANRQVFLYPENWIDPTLRDDRTPFFQELQTELQQGELTAELAENAFQDYLTKLLEVSRLEICGFFWENDTDAATGITHNVFHVFGRTYADPHVYYYRRRDSTTMTWSPWERVDADIQGDHLIPVVWNRRLHLFWPIFKEQTTPGTATGGTTHVPNAGSDAPVSLPLKTLQVRFAWSEYRNGVWTKKQITVDSLTPDGFSNYTWDFDPSFISFGAQVSGPTLTINVFWWRGIWVGSTVVVGGGPVVEPHRGPFGLFNAGSVVFDGCSAVPATFSNGSAAEFHIPEHSRFDYMSLAEQSALNNVLMLTNLVPYTTEVLPGGQVEILYTSNPVTVLGATPTAFSLAYPDEFLPDVQINRAPPFFYADNTRTYLVTQQSFGIATVLVSPDAAVVPYSAEELNPPISPAMLASLPIFADAGAAGPEGDAPSTAIAPTATAEGPPDWQNLSLRPRTRFLFETHRHAHVCDLLKALNWQGVPGLLTLDSQRLDLTDLGTSSAFYNSYAPTSVVSPDYPSEQIDFSSGGAYSVYNWEIFFHIPFLIATQLSRNQQFEDAEKWFRYIFNPGSNSTDPIPGRYWNVLPFHQSSEPERIEDLLTALAYTGTDPTLLAEKASFSQQIAAWVKTPFDPDLIARMRIVAYQKAVVMKYIDHHLAWGDSLYRQFTRESVNEATLHYVLCQDLLGDKPVVVPPQGVIPDETYYSLTTTSPGLDNFSDALVALETLFPFSTDGVTANSADSGSGTATGIALVPYFCTPPNDILFGYWDTVAQRLYQIRHCMNIAGQVQQLPLFAPPISPGLLIQALEMGMDLTSALSDISAATPFYRFAYMLPRALELCAEVRSLGASLLSALEKSDAEALSMLRATQETALMKAVRNVKQQQLNEANSNWVALNDSLTVTTGRQTYYGGLIKAGLNSSENAQFQHLQESSKYESRAENLQKLAAGLYLVPVLASGTAGPGGSPFVTLTQELATAAAATATLQQTTASHYSTYANLDSLRGGWDRRKQEWQFQLDTATLEIQQINDQIKAAQARIDAAQADLDNQDLQISHAQDVESFLRTKFTNQALYDWMVGEVSSVYFQCYQIAYDLAKRAESCFIFERMPDLSSYTSFIQFGYWDSLKKGLLSGERLYQDLKRLEIAYMEQNQREYEITKSISLLLLDPMALINLKETGQCTVQFPEALFDMDYPGHFLRRIKSIGLTIPCVVGPYTSVNCTLTLAGNKIRVDNTAADAKDYVRDSHYLTNLAAAESIATSSGQNDSGLFVVNFNDERYLPFEGAGVISTWQLSMPKDTNAFDFGTITDVIFNLHYTAQDGGASLRDVARKAAVLPPGSAPGASPAGQSPLPQQQALTRLFSLRHEFPSEWHAFLHPPDSAPDQTMTINLTQERFPFLYRGKRIQIYQVAVFLKFRDMHDPAKYAADGTPLGDYAAKADGMLTLNLTPPSGTAKTLQLVSKKGILADRMDSWGVPYGTVPQPPPTVPPVPPALGSIGAWTLVARGTDIGNIAASLQTQATSGANTYNRLAIAVVEDVFLVSQFAVG